MRVDAGFRDRLKERVRKILTPRDTVPDIMRGVDGPIGWAIDDVVEVTPNVARAVTGPKYTELPPASVLVMGGSRGRIRALTEDVAMVAWNPEETIFDEDLELPRDEWRALQQQFIAEKQYTLGVKLSDLKNLTRGKGDPRDQPGQILEDPRKPPWGRRGSSTTVTMSEVL